MKTINLFSEKRIEDLFFENDRAYERDIDKNFSTLELQKGAEYLARKFFLKYEINVPKLDFANIDNEINLEGVLGSRFPGQFLIRNPHEVIKIVVVTYAIPFTGDSELLKYSPRRFHPSSIQVAIENNLLKFKIPLFDYMNIELPDNKKQELLVKCNQICDKIIGEIKNLENECNDYNSQLLYNMKNYIEKKIEDKANKSNDL